MPAKISFTVVSSTGEDERYRATELNYHGPTVRGWRSPMNSSYPQEVVMQLNVAAVVHRIQILSHQYLIPQKIEIWTSEGADYDPSLSPSGGESFEYLGFITLSDNQSTGFKSRELKSITVPPTTAKYIKLRLHSNYSNEKNVYNQVGLIAVNVLGDEVQEFDADGDEVNNNGSYYNSQQCETTLISNPQYVSPYDDLAFEMYVDKDVARIMRIMEAKKHQAVLEERFEYASKLKLALEDLREAGETLGKFEQEKRQAINTEDYDKAKLKKLQIEQYREQVHRVLNIEQLLELDGALEENDVNCGSLVNKTIRKQELAPPQLESLEAESTGKVHRGTPSPSQELVQEEKREWDYSQCKFPYLQTSNHLIHSQSQTSFERFGNQEDSPPSLTPRYIPSTFSNPQLVEYPTTLQHSHIFSTLKYQAKTPLYNSHTWQTATSIQDGSEMYHSMPMPQTVERKILPCGKSNTAEFPLPQRTSTEGEVEACGQKTVEFESPIAQTIVPAFETGITVAQSKEDEESSRPKSPADSYTSLSKSPPTSNVIHRPSSLRGSLRKRNKSTDGLSKKTSYEAYEERMLPALRHYHANEIVRECQLGLVEPTKKSKLNEREKKQAALPITVFGIELVEKFYSKHFADKEEGLKQLQEYLKRQVHADGENPEDKLQHPPNKIARATIFLLHRALRDKVYSVYSSAADTIRLFFSEYVPKRVSSAEVARSVEKLLPELIVKSGDATPRIHNMAAHTLLSMADCKEVRELHIIPVHLSRPLTSSVHPRLALSRLEMIEQLILNQGISTDKQSGLTCRTLAEFGSSGLHHPAEAVRKVSERILIQVYRVNPRLVRKQLPPDDDITRRNLLYRQLFQEFDFMDLQRKREMNEKPGRIPAVTRVNDTQGKVIQPHWENCGKQEEDLRSKGKKEKVQGTTPLAKKTVNQQTSPMKPFSPSLYYPPNKEEISTVRQNGTTEHKISPSKGKVKGTFCNGDLEKRKGMTRIAEEKADAESKEIEEDVTLKFPNLVDSVTVAEDRFTQKSFRNLKSLKYIFPTTYIGNSTTSQAVVNTSNSVNSICRMVKKPELSIAKQSTSHSGIPVPTNGRFLTPIVPARKSGKENEKHFSTEKIANRDGLDGNGIGCREFITSETRAESFCFGNDAKGSSAAAAATAEQEADEEKPAATEEKIAHDNNSTNLTTPTRETEESPPNKNIDTKQTFKMCIFCFASDNWFTEESLNNHYWKSCPMLTRCIYCKEVVEISGLIQHRLDDCEHKHIFQKCERCQEAIPKDVMGDHDCTASETKNSKLRCPMCHSDVESEDGWRDHLMGKKVCPNHPRRHLNPANTAN